MCISVEMSPLMPPERAGFFYNVKKRKTTMSEKRLVSEWLSDYDGHDILTCDDAAQAFEKETGYDPSGWPRITAADMRRALEAEGRGGYLNGDTDVVAALDLSDKYASELAKYYSPKMGRGFRHRDNIRALKEAGF